MSAAEKLNPDFPIAEIVTEILGNPESLFDGPNQRALGSAANDEPQLNELIQKLDKLGKQVMLTGRALGEEGLTASKDPAMFEPGARSTGAQGVSFADRFR